MAYFTDLASLKTAVTDHLNVTITASNLSDLVLMGETKTVRKLRVREMETALSITISSNVAAVPSGLLEVKFAYINDSPVRRLERKSPGWIYEKYPTRSAGEELYFAREGTNFIFGPAGTNGHVMKGIYYATPTAMTAAVHSVFTAYPDVFFWAILSESEPFIGRDQRIALWESKFQQSLMDANKLNVDELYSGSPLAMTVS
jgi:hypothetical protein